MKNENDSCWNQSQKAIAPDTGKSLEVQLVLSLVIGVSAFLLFCVRSSLARLQDALLPFNDLAKL
jgi:hypothetical protein